MEDNLPSSANSCGCFPFHSLKMHCWFTVETFIALPPLCAQSTVRLVSLSTQVSSFSFWYRNQEWIVKKTNGKKTTMESERASERERERERQRDRDRNRERERPKAGNIYTRTPTSFHFQYHWQRAAVTRTSSKDAEIANTLKSKCVSQSKTCSASWPHTQWMWCLLDLSEHKARCNRLGLVLCVSCSCWLAS